MLLRGHALILILLLQSATYSEALKNDFATLSSLCSGQSSNTLLSSSPPRAVDGMVLVASGESQLDCLLTFQTESILERFRLRFEQLSLDCNDRLLLYDGAHAIGNARANLSCEAMAELMGILTTNTNYLTLRYLADSWTTLNNGFKLVLTAFKQRHEGFCRDGFDCEIDEGVCIDNDLVCDNVNHCGNAADERHSQFCSLKREGSLFSAIMSVGRICPCENDELGDSTPIELTKWLSSDPNSLNAATILLILLLVLALALMCYAKHIRHEAVRNERLGLTRGPIEPEIRPNLGKINNNGIIESVVPSLSGVSSSTSLMATGNTHHIFDSAPPIQDDPFAESSKALTSLIDNSGNARRPGCGTPRRPRGRNEAK